MKLKRRIIFFLSILFLGLVGFGLYSMYKYITNQPPTEASAKALEALAYAKSESANKYATAKVKKAELVHSQAMREWDYQNKKYFFSRNFDRVEKLMIEAESLALEASGEATNRKVSAKGLIEKKLKTTLQELELFEKKFKILPLSSQTFSSFSKSKMLYTEALGKFKEKDYHEAEKAIKESETQITKINKIARNKLTDYYRDFPIWKRNARRAREMSRNGQIVILVNKFESTCYVLKSEKVIAEYKSEFGTNWMGDKRFMGDHATPEGIYKVVKMKSGSKTRYYKSLTINYPNDDDEAAFNAMKKSGSISKKSKIGSLIQIHGFGGKGVHWTQGCIALENKDMDKIYNIARINTPVVIIGSEQPLSEYLK
jgi:L,D-peptidoglycan transpeptidase YkuD (ErfK/YbiS/YcfS/YnhG family)